MRNNMNARDTALELLARGLRPVVLRPRGMRYADANGVEQTATGKEPMNERWGVGKVTAATLRAAYRRHPEAGVGIALGPAGGAVDFECDGAEGEDALIRLFGGEIVPTLGWTSVRGPHHLFRWDDRLAGYNKTIIKLASLPGLEIRLGGEGKQLQSACPPTPGTDGSPRRWNAEDQIAELPEALFAYLDAAQLQPAGGGSSPPAPDHPMIVTANNGASPARRARAYVFAPGFPDSIQGQHGHDRLYHVACVLIDGFGLTRNEAEPIFHDWNAQKANPPEGEAQIAHKLDDAIKNHPAPSRKLMLADRGDARRGVRAEVSPGPPSVVHLHPWPAPPGEAAFHGRVGKIVELIAEHTEADRVGILAQLLIGFGNAVGRGPWIDADGVEHYANEFVVTVGQSSRARKGTGWARARKALEHVDLWWVVNKVVGGLSTGEGLIHEIRDPVTEPGEGGALVVTDEGVVDKRLLAVETEFGSMLRTLRREGNSLSGVLRKAWDGEQLRTLTKHSPTRATNPHVSLIGHVTHEELARYLDAVEIFNGLGNRMIWVAVRRAKLLPFGGKVPSDRLASLGAKLAENARRAATLGRLQWSDDAAAIWVREYPRLTAERPGLWGAVTSRGEAHVIRLALLYAIADGADTIAVAHLEAALGLWRYADASAGYLFGQSTGDRDADATLDALNARPDGLTRTEISRLVFQGNRTGDQIARALGVLLRYGLARCETVPTDGRDAERWTANVAATDTEETKETE
jgi:hypothetical protein